MKSKRQLIFETAARLFHRQGFKGTSLQEIAKEVGMEAPSLYNHIQSKSEILSILLLTLASRFDKGMDAIASSSLSPIDKLKKLVGLHVSLTLENGNAMALMLSDWIYLGDEARAEYLRMKDEYEERFRQILEKGIEEGQLRQMDQNLMMFSILSTLRSLYAWTAKYSEYNPIELEIQISGALLDGVLADS